MPEETQDSNEQHKAVTITVNGRQKEVTTKEVTYDQIVSLAFDTPPDPSQIVVITYRRGEGDKSGTLVKGGSVKVKDGMIFDATPTYKS
jgi:uncharacterized protein YabE (DUF348 family)